jgi:hypothetical protein
MLSKPPPVFSMFPLRGVAIAMGVVPGVVGRSL